MLHFTQKQPHPALRQYIRSYWLLEGGSQAERLELVPDGYPEMFFTLQSSIKIFRDDNQWSAFAPAGIIGQVTQKFYFETAANARVLYVKMYPWAPAALFKMPGNTLTNVSLDMAAISHHAVDRNLANRIYDTTSLDEAAQVLDAYFLQKLSVVANNSSFLQYAVRQIFASNGTVGIDRLTENIHASRRYVEKLFHREIGLGPKQYARLIRVKKATMYMLEPGFNGQLTDIAHALNYYDQSHFLKDFKSIVQQTPTSFLQQCPDFSLSDLDSYLRQWDYS
jgi:AraC-like DNA-binding protein